MKTKNKIYIISATFIIVSLFLILFFIYPTLKNIKDGSEDILSYKSRVILIDAETMELDNFKKKYNDYEINFKKIDQLFVDSKNPIDFIKFLEKMASDSNIDIDINLIPPKKGDADNLSVAVFQVSANGEFSNILNFSEKIETGSYLIKIQNLTIKKPVLQGVDKEKNLDANFLIEAIANKS